MTMNLPPPPPRPPSPTELSYTKLSKLATPFSGKNDRSSKGGVGIGKYGGVPSMPMPSMPSAPHTAPPASINVPHSSIGNSSIGIDDGRIYSNNDTRAVGPISSHNDYYQTPQHTQSILPMSAPLPQHYSTHQPMNYQQQTSQQLGDPFSNRTTPIEDRVSNIASKLQAMQTTHGQQQSNHVYTPTLQPQHNQHHQSNRLHELHQFIETLKNMQMAVSRTADENQRVKKSRALNALLTMFESIIDERQMRLATDPSSESTIRQLEQKIQQLEVDNEQLNMICQERDGQLQQLESELQHSQHTVQSLTEQNEQLQHDTARAQEQCQQEQQRASEAELIATESENVRNGMLSNYAILTEENVELQSAMAEMSNDKQRMIAELDMHRQEVTQVQSQMNQLSQQLQQKNMDIVQLERQVDDLNDQLKTQENLLQSANGDRQRLREELSNSQRNSTAASEQLMRLRDQFSQFRMGGGDSRRLNGTESSQEKDGRRFTSHDSQATHEAEEANAVLEKSELEEQQRRRILEMSIRKQMQQGNKEVPVQTPLARIPEQSHVEFESKAANTTYDPNEQQERPKGSASISANSLSSGLDRSVASREQRRQLQHIPEQPNREVEPKVEVQTNVSRPKSAVDDASSSGVDSILRNNSCKNDISSFSGISKVSSNQKLPQELESDLDTKINELDSLIMELSPSSSRPSMADTIMNTHRRSDSLSPESIESLQPYKPRTGDKDSNLMEYFYNQFG